MLIPIAKDSNDPFFRYKMPEVEVIYTKKNAKTTIKNITEIAHSLGRNNLLIMKFLSKALATSICNENTFNGNFKNTSIQDAIYKFVDDFVLCNLCNNPETFYSLGNDKIAIYIGCNACGERYLLSKTNKMCHLINKDDIMEDKKYKQEVVNIGSDFNPINNSSLIGDYLNSGDHNILVQAMENIVQNENMLELKKLSTDTPDKNYCKNVLGALEMAIVKYNQHPQMSKYLRYIIDEGIMKKLEIFKYFQTKSKFIDKKSSKELRDLLNGFFD